MIKENKEIYEKLISFGVEKLANILIKLSEENDVVENYIKSITSTDKENVKRFTKELNKLKRRKRFIEWDKSRDFAEELENILEILESGVTDSIIGIELIIAFFEMDSIILELCDDSSGIVGEVFTYYAKNLFTNYASKCSNKELIIKQLFNLYKEDCYGVRTCLIENIKDFLPEESIKNLADLFLKESENPSKKRICLLAVKILSKQLKLPEMFKNAELSISPELGFYSLLEISEVYLESGDANNALSYLQKISDKDRYFESKKDDLLLRVYNKLENHEKESEIALKIFYKNRNETNFQKLLKIIGEKERENIINDVFLIISKEKVFSSINVNFMIFTGFIEKAENYILEYKDELNGDYYSELLPIAESMEKNNNYLSTSVIYRALLDSILRRAKSKHYTYAVKYLKKLDKLALQIIEWKEVISHNEYFQEIKKNHNKKYAFWNSYE